MCILFLIHHPFDLGSITGDGGNEIAGSKEKEFGAMDTY